MVAAWKTSPFVYMLGSLYDGSIVSAFPFNNFFGKTHIYNDGLVTSFGYFRALFDTKRDQC